MVSGSQDMIQEFLKKLEIENISKDIIEKLEGLLHSQSEVSHYEIVNLIEESISKIDKN